MSAGKINKKPGKVNLTEKVLSGKDKLFGREKSRYLREKFQQVVVQALQKQGEHVRNYENAEQEVDMPKQVDIPKQIDISLNLSKMNLVEFPLDLLERIDKVQYLYLEGTKLTQLPKNFFQKLPSLQWLDLRNNSLTELPNIGLKNHPSLEVILLQGNKIRNLPIELATIPTLRGLQTTGNPLTNVPYDCIAQGFSAIIQHLKKLCSQNDVLVPGSQTLILRPSTSQDESQARADDGDTDHSFSDFHLKMYDLEKLSQWRHFIKKKSKTPHIQPLAPNNEKQSQQKMKVSVTRTKAPFKIAPFRCGTHNRHRHYLKVKKTRLGYRRKPITLAMIEEKARKEAYAAQMRETLEKQARIIQTMRDKEVLKAWRNHARLTNQQIKLLDNYQRSKDFAKKTPFDVDPEFLNMLNRADLYRSLKEYDSRSKKVKKPKVRVTALDLERQMNEIISKLKNLDTNETEESSSPRSKEVHMCNKMSKILDIQKTLKRLQGLNSSMAGITPLGKH